MLQKEVIRVKKFILGLLTGIVIGFGGCLIADEAYRKSYFKYY